jgi:hypothetical protein
MDFGNASIKIDNDFYFQRELHYLDRFRSKSWAPEIISIDTDRKKIFFKWYGHTCNDIIFNGHDVDNLKLYNCAKDILDSGIYKLNVYPHCFYFDHNGNIHAMDFYACVDISDPYIPLDRVKNVIGQDNLDRWSQAIEGDRVNFEIFFKQGIMEYIRWPGDPLKGLLNV